MNGQLIGSRRSLGRRPWLDLPPAATVGLLGALVGVALGLAVVIASPTYVIAGLVGLVVVGALLSDVRFGLFGFVAVATLVPFVAIPVEVGPLKLTLVDLTL